MQPPNFDPYGVRGKAVVAGIRWSSHKKGAKRMTFTYGIVPVGVCRCLTIIQSTDYHKIPTSQINVYPKNWAMDLLPFDLQNIRTLTYGYDSNVTRAFTAPPSQNYIHQRGKSFLRALDRRRPLGRPWYDG